MILGIDASRYGHEQATGVELYSWHLLNELIPLLGRDHNCEVRLYSSKALKLKVDPPFNVKKRVIPFKRFWTLVRLSWELLVHPVNVLFVPSHTLPLVFPKKSIITIHDVAFKRFKNIYDRRHYWILNSSTKKAVRRAWKIIVPSVATKKDLVELFGCKAGKIVVIPHGAPEISKLRHYSTEEKQKLLNQFHLLDSDLFALFIGRLEAKKNLSRLVEGFARFLKEFPDWKLVLAGKRGVGFDEIWKTVVAHGMQDTVLMPGYISEHEKDFLYDKCRMVAFPSLYEGFGLPVLEAFAHRRPILVSKVSSLPEVAGNAAFMVDPEKPEEIGVGLKRLASDGMLVSQLIVRGEQQLKRFNWEKAAKQTFEVLFG